MHKITENIPPLIHFIWFGDITHIGSYLPDFTNCISRHNLQKTIYLWTLFSEEQEQKEQTVNLITLCQTNNITLRNLCTDADISKCEISNAIIHLIKIEISHGRYAVASDIARILILYLNGGFYFDIDIEIKDINNCSSLQRFFSTIEQNEYGTGTFQLLRNNNSQLDIYFMAVTAEHPLYLGCLRYIVEHIYSKDLFGIEETYCHLYKSINRNTIYELNMLKMGRALDRVLFCSKYSTMLSQIDACNIFDATFMHKRANSWLQTHKSILSNFEKTANFNDKETLDSLENTKIMEKWVLDGIKEKHKEYEASIAFQAIIREVNSCQPSSSALTFIKRICSLQ
jgi:hypothetical protein